MAACIRHIPVRVAEDINEELMREVTDKEIKEATFSLGSLKAPGPDGLNGLFYQKHWTIVGEVVCDVVKSFFHDGNLPSSIGKTFIVLAPKISRPETLNHLRPISCCNFIYKIISRMLVIRLRKIMDKIISPIQSAFVGGRLIQDNLVIVQEMFHDLNRKGTDASRNLAIKIDMNKAYDRVEWSFLEATLRAFGFNPHWIKLLMKCVSQAKEEGRISGVKIAPTAPAISHLFFADDCIIFSKDSKEEIYQLITILNLYTEASGQRINLDKSGITFGKLIPIRTRVEIEEILGLSAWDNPGKYLGIPAYWGRSKNSALSWIEDRVVDKLGGWKQKLLNQAGKEVLIKSIVQAFVNGLVRKLPSFGGCPQEPETTEHALLLCPWTRAA
ncbi:uncharacterized protein LOC107615916 [Arachis ipaensis]|uniref:uncharacterized protein LOC107615916 n=1 Tax=Arachis ipaensis TaxID=130454 RepID=UPI0007AFC764|nr:uncharacterized protein LOC107615916 [Arachis ipaensis]